MYNIMKAVIEAKTFELKDALTKIAPESVVCVWDPEEYPAYWEVCAE